MTLIRPRTALFAVGYGLLIWFEATIMIRWLGEWIFLPQSTPFTIALFAVTVLVVYSIGWCFFYMFRTPHVERAASAVLICAAGLIANAAVIGWNAQVFPSFTPEQHRLFASWVVWAYGTGLISGIWPRQMPFMPGN
jgi:hypothetical protein